MFPPSGCKDKRSRKLEYECKRVLVLVSSVRRNTFEFFLDIQNQRRNWNTVLGEGGI